MQMHVYDYRRLVVPIPPWSLVILPLCHLPSLSMANLSSFLKQCEWLNGHSLVVGYTLGPVFRPVFPYAENLRKQQMLQGLIPNANTFYQRYFEKRCEQLVLPEELCRLVSSFLFVDFEENKSTV